MNPRLASLPLIVFVLAATPSATRGHVLDEYLESTLVVIEPGDIRLKINLTPGVEIAEKVISQIDHNGDAVVSSDESAAYAEMLRKHLTVRLDGRDTQLKLTTFKMPELTELHTGHGIIQVEFSISPCSFRGGKHQLTFENRHFDTLGVYLVNAARPHSASIQITGQQRNANQSKGEIEFVYAASDSHSLRTTGIFASLAIIVVGMLTALRRLKTTACKSPGSRFKGK